ncbi:hypothetical protein QVD17_19541 [Tagetes erecta]|uniref:Uncharacterized protein n=1 Tax=Tagetes erecta TaxID=13708 RepID=A0AAD8KJM9_TARER|nr:hypothetical protein QVD17_19541 [Tagetes erecta]
MKNMEVQIGFQIVKRISSTMGLSRGLVLPKALINKLSMKCDLVKLLDSRGLEYSVRVFQFADDSFRIGNEELNLFWKRNVIIDSNISMLCFRIIGDDMLKVFCFNSDGLEVGYKNQNELLDRQNANRFLIQATPFTIYEQLLPECFLSNWNTSNLRAEIFGTKQNAKVEVVLQCREGERRKRASGFGGSQWMLFCLENNIDEGCMMMFQRVDGDKFNVNVPDKFYIDVFNKLGVGVGLTVDPGWSDTETDDHELGLYGTFHQCRINGHMHSDQNPTIFIKFPSHLVESNQLNIPRSFVAKHDLHLFKKAIFSFGHMQFRGTLHIKKDSQRPGDLSHLICKLDWTKFVQKTGISIGEWVRFEMIPEGRSGRVLFFTIC